MEGPDVQQLLAQPRGLLLQHLVYLQLLVLVYVFELLAIQQLLSTLALGLVLLEHARDQLETALGVAAEGLVELQRRIHDLRADFALIKSVSLGFELGYTLGDHLLEKHAAAPDVLRLVLSTRAREHLWRHVDVGALEEVLGLVLAHG